jgi:hypothetical protein
MQRDHHQPKGWVTRRFQAAHGQLGSTTVQPFCTTVLYNRSVQPPAMLNPSTVAARCASIVVSSVAVYPSNTVAA